jgi:hypothetical protein
MNLQSVISLVSIVKDKKGNLLVESHSTLNRWKNHFCQLLTVHRTNDVRQIKIHMAQSLVPEHLKFRWLLKSLKDINHKVVITFQVI